MMINEQLREVDQVTQLVMAHSVAKRSCPMFSSPGKWMALVCFTLGSVTPPHTAQKEKKCLLSQGDGLLML